MDALNLFTEPTREWFRASFGSPTAAQEGAWTSVAEGRNALVVAPTGSGKTLSAFLWALDRLFAEASGDGEAGELSASGEVNGEGLREAGADPGPHGTRVLYISPLKALGVDIERNLRSPLVGIAHTARRLGMPARDISVGVRTGDSTSKQRRDLVRNPPEVLITTPESLYLMLTSQARKTLTGVKTVIVDEVHALAGTKRGAHLAVSLERLDDLLTRPAQRIGLSATVEPREEVARYLGGTRDVQIVAPPSEKSWDITVSVPVEDLANPVAESGAGSQPMQPSIWPHVEHKVVELIASRRSTICFVNSRRLAEKLTGRINEIWAEKEASGGEDEDAQGEDADLARAHHGSVSKDQRAMIEEDLKSGRLKCVVATSSLELGIDMGAVDLVIQVESPPAVSAALQRIGRAGHHVGEVSIGWFFPKHRGDLVSTAVVAERMLAGRIEALHVPRNPLDILAQQTVAACAMDILDVEHWYEVLRRSAPFSSLPRSAFESTLDLLAGRYPSDRFAELRPRIVWDRDAGTISGRPGAQRLAVTSGGTIPDRGLFGVYLASSEDSGSARSGGRRVGELDEEMVYESRVGDVFALGATSWRIEEITFDRVLVSPAFGQPASLPFWRGDGIGRPAELGAAMGAFVREVQAASATSAQQRLSALGLDTWARENLRRYLDEQRQAAGALPTDETLVVERTKDELGDWRIILHSPYGLQVHAPWALAVGVRLHERYGLDGAAMASDDGIVLRVPDMDEQPPGADMFRFDNDELEELVTEQVSSSALFSGRFREAAARSLLLPRQNPGKRTPLWQQRQRSSQLLQVASGYPDFPIIMETMREVLQDVYDMPALAELTAAIGQRRITLVETTTTTPSPFAQSVLFGYIAQYLYEGDSPLAERRAAALSVDTDLLGELLGRVELREFLDAGIIAETHAQAQRLAPSRRLRGVEGAADLLRLLGPLGIDALAERLHAEEQALSAAEDSAPGESPESEEGPELAEPGHLNPGRAAEHVAELVSQQRAFQITWKGETRYAAIEDAARLRDGLGVALPQGIPHVFLDPVEDPLGDVVSRYARTNGPFTAREAAEELHLSPAVVAEVLHRLVAESRVVEGMFRPDHAHSDGPGSSSPVETEYCETEMLRRIRRRSLAALRAEVEPVPQAVFAQFLTEWQSVTPREHVQGVAGLADVLAQLAGTSAPASAWESFILPARVSDYRPSMLDELLASGDILAVGRGALTGHDGWVAFYPREDAEVLLDPAARDGAGSLPGTFTGPTAPNASEPGTDLDPTSGDASQVEPEPGSARDAVLQVLARGGAWFPEGIYQSLAGGTGFSATTVSETLWSLFWEGLVVPDSYAVVRQLMRGGGTSHRKQRQAVSLRHGSRRMALRHAAHQARSGRGRSSQSSAARGPAESGRWSLLRPVLPAGGTRAAATAAAHTRAEILLDRYGVVTRGSVIAEQNSGGAKDGNGLAGGFASVYKVLAAAEDSGQVRRGYFIEQLGAAQFTASETIDRLRHVGESLEDAEPALRDTAGAPGRSAGRSPSHEITVLAATDPANAYGAALDWPALEDSSHRPGRKAGAVVALYRGHLILYMERGGRTLLLFTEDESLFAPLAEALVVRLRTAQSGKLAVEKINGERILGHAFAQALRDAGFHSSPSGLRFAP